LVTGFLAGSYPALYLSSFEPAKVLKGKMTAASSGGLMRKSLVVFQFVIAITLVCGMFIVTKQLKYMQQRDLGFDSTNKIILPLRSQSARDQHQTMRNELLTVPAIKDVAGVHWAPGGHIWNDFSLYPEGSTKEKAVMVKNSWIESNYLDLMDIKLVAGRGFTNNRESETQNKIIINRTAAEKLGFKPEEIVGRPLYDRNATSFEVIGVMEDYHQVSLREEIYPILFRIPETASIHRFMIIDVTSENIPETISDIESTWKKLNPETPFEYSFLDDTIRKQYDEDKRVSRVITGFTVIAMIISCLGLYGLSTYMAERRFKEIGVRKVMGASVTQLVSMMSTEFMQLVVIAFVIAVPLAWYGITAWLQSFAYKTPVGITIFVAAGISALTIALLTVSFESMKAASGDPAKALRNE
jgi:putative ABC transport system permease protein